MLSFMGSGSLLTATFLSAAESKSLYQTYISAEIKILTYHGRAVKVPAGITDPVYSP